MFLKELAAFNEKQEDCLKFVSKVAAILSSPLWSFKIQDLMDLVFGSMSMEKIPAK